MKTVSKNAMSVRLVNGYRSSEAQSGDSAEIRLERTPVPAGKSRRDLSEHEKAVLTEVLHDPCGDRERAARLGKAIADLQEALDAAIMSGLMVEPEFRVVSHRFSALGVTADSYLLKIDAYRKLV